MTKPAVIAVALVTIVLYALNYVLAAVAVRTANPFLVLTLRWIVIAVVLWSAVLALRIPLPRGRALWEVIGVNTLTQGGQFIAGYWALGHGASAGIVSLIIAMNPVATVVATAVVLRRAQGSRAWSAAMLGAVAVVIACLPRIEADPRIGPVLFVVVLALFGLSLGSLWQGERLREESPIAINAIGACVGLPLVAPFLLASAPSLPADSGEWLLVLAMGIIGAMGTTGYSWLVRRVGAGEAAMVFCVIPAVTAILTWILLGEPITIPVLAGLLLGSTACALRAMSHRGANKVHPSRRAMTAVSAQTAPIARSRA